VTVPTDLFRGSRLKIKRANQHIDELNAALNAFVETDFCSLAVEKDSDTGEHVLQFRMTTPIPDCVPLILGDAVHNLRASLDFVVSEIIHRANGSRRYIKFPIRDTKQEVEAAVKGGAIKVASQSVISAIVDEVKPYKGGNDPLCAIHEMDITDKHLLLLPVISVAALTNVALVVGGIEMEDCTFEVAGGTVLRIMAGLPGEAEFKNHGKPAFAVRFAQGQPFEGKEIIPALVSFSQIVSSSVDDIENAFVK